MSHHLLIELLVGLPLLAGGAYGLLRLRRRPAAPVPAAAPVKKAITPAGHSAEEVCEMFGHHHQSDPCGRCGKSR